MAPEPGQAPATRSRLEPRERRGTAARGGSASAAAGPASEGEPPRGDPSGTRKPVSAQRLEREGDPSLQGEAREALQPVGEVRRAAATSPRTGKGLLVAPPQGNGLDAGGDEQGGHVLHEERMAESPR